MSDQAQADSHSDSLCSSQVRGGRHLLVLSSAGKPIFSLQHGDETSVADLAALVAAIVSFVQRGGDEIRHVRAGATSLAFLVRGPLYLVASSSCGDTVPYLSRQLAALHAQLLSVLTSKVEEVFAHGGFGQVVRGELRLLFSSNSAEGEHEGPKKRRRRNVV